MKHLLAFTAVIITSFAVAPSAFASEIIDENTVKKSEVVQISTQAHSGIDDVIKKQLQAIRERNDRAAFEFSTSAIQEEFEDPQSFMRDLRRTKKPLYNHVDYNIIPATRENAKFHKVMLTDKYGKSIMAMFKMEKDEGGEWKTKDIVVLTPSDDAI